jgi:hypothetical protein
VPGRFEQRIGRATASDERALIADADRLYQALATEDPHSFQIIDRRRHDEEAALAMIIDACRAAVARDARCRA